LISLSGYKRIGITGTVGAGKTTLASSLSPTHSIYHTDDLKHLPWKQQPLEWLEELNSLEEPFVVEGITVARMCRKGLQLDILIVLTEPRKELTKKQIALSKAVNTIVDELRDQNIRRTQ